MAAQIKEIAYNLIGIVSLGHNSILKRDSVIFAGAARHSDTLRRHNFQSDQAERLMSAVGKSRISSRVGRTYKFLGQEETQVIDISGSGLLKCIEALLLVRTLRHYILDLQTAIMGMTENIRAMWLNTTTNKEGNGMTG